MVKFELSKDVGLPSVLVILAGILGIVAFFIAWLPDITGMQLYENGASAIGFFDQWKCYIPLLVMVMSVIVLLVSILPLIGVGLNEKIIAGEYILLGIIGIVAVIIFGTTNVDGYGDFFGKAQVGLWLGLIAMIITTVVGLLNANNIRKA